MSLRRLPALALFLAAAVVGGCQCDQAVLRTLPPPETRTDRICQITASSIDILFVVDNSRSMVEEQDALAANFGRFLELVDPDPETFGEKGEVDYRIAVTTTDALGTGGELVGQPAIIRPGAGYNPLIAFQTNVKVGSGGGALEQGLRAAELAVQRSAALQDDSGKAAFIRPGAYLYVIVVSDEEDSSFGEVRYYQRYFEQVKGIGNENTVALSAIAGPVPGGCGSAAPGVRYEQVASATGGLLGDICTADWEHTLRDLAVSGLGLRRRFQLPVVPGDADASGGIDEPDLRVVVSYPCDSQGLDDLATICAEVQDSCGTDGGDVKCFPFYDYPDGWLYDAAEGTVAFDGEAVPGPGSCVEVTYYPRDL